MALCRHGPGPLDGVGGGWFLRPLPELDLWILRPPHPYPISVDPQACESRGDGPHICSLHPEVCVLQMTLGAFVSCPGGAFRVPSFLTPPRLLRHPPSPQSPHPTAFVSGCLSLPLSVWFWLSVSVYLSLYPLLQGGSFCLVPNTHVSTQADAQATPPPSSSCQSSRSGLGPGICIHVYFIGLSLLETLGGQLTAQNHL